jgi:hypothetical protein
MPAKEKPSAPEALDSEPPNPKRRRLDHSTNVVPRLISVAEIVKREYAKSPVMKDDAPLSLHQYNEIGCLEAHKDAIETEETTDVSELATLPNRQEQLHELLSGIKQ